MEFSGSRAEAFTGPTEYPPPGEPIMLFAVSENVPTLTSYGPSRTLMICNVRSNEYRITRDHLTMSVKTM
jgi:hypothetical protein